MSIRSDADLDKIANETVDVINPTGSGRFLIVCEHASSFIPPELGDLGLEGDILRSHIAWDPGALPVAIGIAKALDAPLVAHRISRLVYDCNRPLVAPSAIPAKSEKYDIPGNTGLDNEARRRRFDRYYVPFRSTLNGHIDRKIDNGQQPVIVTVHSFTPIFQGVLREVDIGILHDADSSFADKLLESCSAEKTYSVRRNAPYGPEDGVTHTLATHAIPRGLPNVMFETKNSLIADETGQLAIANWLARHLTEAAARLHDLSSDDHRAQYTR